MPNTSNFEKPELGDYSREEFVLREQTRESEPLNDLANKLESDAKIDPIQSLRHFLEEAKALLAKLV